jgi:hypothetical protein
MWWTFAWASARWELGRLRRHLRPEAAQAPDPEPIPEATPEPLPVREPLPLADSTEARAAYTIPEECRLHILAEWYATASDGTRELGADLADRLRTDLPDVRDSDVAKVLLALEGVLEQVEAEQPSAESALTVIRDALLGAPVRLAELDLALAERGRAW